MSNTEVVHVKLRETRGSREARRLRAQGHIPAVLYGHGEGTLSLTIPSSEIDALLRHGGRVVELQGAATGNALVRSVQWDAFGAHILHLDLARVSTTELVTTRVPVELRGDAPGTRSGGVVKHLLHELEISSPVAALPEKIRVSINHLELGQEIKVSDLELPAGVTALADADSVVVSCEEAVLESEEAMAAEGAEPELIGRKAQEEEAGD